MSSTTPRIVVDGLWHCLCPSYSAVPFSTARNALTRRRRPALQCAASKQPLAAVRRSSGWTPINFKGNVDVPTDLLVQSDLPAMTSWSPLTDASQSKTLRTTSRTTVRQTAIVKKAEYPRIDTPELYELAHAAAVKGNNREALALVEYLVRERREAPNLRLYSISILANIHPSEGSASKVARLLHEMEDEGIPIDVQICHDVLRVLSVHMDYLLRIDIQAYMRRKWLQLSTEGYHWVGAALLREGQLELAAEHLESMRRDNIPIQSWLYDVAMYTMLETNEFDETLTLIKDRIMENDWTTSRNLWTHMLDRAAAAFHHAVTVYVWNSQVIPGYLNPSSGTCLNVLSTAARNGDAALATSVFHILGKRSTNFKQTHYDQLITTYMSTSPPDLRAAITVLTIMANVKIAPTTLSTRPILIHLRRYPSDCSKLFDIITSLHESGREIPIAALNLLIESYVETDQLAQALTAYKHLHLFERLPTDPQGNPVRRSRSFTTLETFNILLRGAAKPSATDAYEVAMFLVSELLALGVRPDYLVYDRLIMICIQDKKLDIAYRYFDEMVGLDLFPRQKNAEWLAKEFAERRDDRCFEILQRLHDKGFDVDARIKDEIELAFAESQ